MGRRPRFDEEEWKVVRDREATWREHPPVFGAIPQQNLHLYLNSLPWIIVKPIGGYDQFFCALCGREANMGHILSDDHNKRAENPAANMELAWLQQFAVPHAGQVLMIHYHLRMPAVGDPYPAEEQPALHAAAPRQEPAVGGAVDLTDGGIQRFERLRLEPAPAAAASSQQGPERPPAQEAWAMPPPPVPNGVPDNRADLALLDAPARPEEIRLRDTWSTESQRYASWQMALFEKDHYADFGDTLDAYEYWEEYVRAVNGGNGTQRTSHTMAMNVNLALINDEQQLQVTYDPERWRLTSARGRAQWTISRSHPCTDMLATLTQVRFQDGLITLEWKETWGSLEVCQQQVPVLPKVPQHHWRIDLAIDYINPQRVQTAIRALTQARSSIRHRCSVVTPLQAMLASNDLPSACIERINDVSEHTIWWMARQTNCDEPRCGLCWLALERHEQHHAPGCRHTFHHGCAEPWLRAAGLPDDGCPLCTQQAVPPPAHLEEEVEPAQGSDAARSMTAGQDHEMNRLEQERSDRRGPLVRPLRSVRPPTDEVLLRAGQALNQSQMHALLLTRHHYLVLVQGPPGTGKTHLATAANVAWHGSRKLGETILVAAPSNMATDHLLDRTMDITQNHDRVGRHGDVPSVFDAERARFSIAQYAGGQADMPASRRKAVNRKVQNLIKNGHYSAIYATYLRSGDLEAVPIDFALLDEAGQSTEPGTCVPAATASLGGHVVIIGDEQQLPPTVKHQGAAWEGLSLSLLARLRRAHEGLPHVVMLEIQYRMHPGIQRFSNSLYYAGRLRCGLPRHPPSVRGFPWPRLPQPEPHEERTNGVGSRDTMGKDDVQRMVFIHCSAHEDRKDTTSITNSGQVEVVQRLLTMLTLRQDDGTLVATRILSPYGAQVKLLNDTIMRQGDTRNYRHAVISTVDSAQGSEADLVIVSLVRANPTSKVGFTDDARRINVATSRARRAVIIVGHVPTCMAATTSGLPELLSSLAQDGALFEYNQRRIVTAPESRLTELCREVQHQQGDEAAAEATARKRKDSQQHWAKSWAQRVAPPPEAFDAQLRDVVKRIDSHIFELTHERAFLVAAVHVASLHPKKQWTMVTCPTNPCDYDRKLLSHENFFSAVGVALDPGNHVLALMFTLIQTALRLGHSADQTPPPGAGGQEQKCRYHPVLASSAPVGEGGRAGPRVTIRDLQAQSQPPLRGPECLRLVLANLASYEPALLPPIERITEDQCERMGDFLEAVGGVLAPYKPGTTMLKEVLRQRDGYAARHDADAMRALTSLAVATKELLCLAAPADAPHGAPASQIFPHISRAVAPLLTTKELAKHERALPGGCRICAQMRRLGCEHLLASTTQLQQADTAEPLSEDEEEDEGDQAGRATLTPGPWAPTVRSPKTIRHSATEPEQRKRARWETPHPPRNDAGEGVDDFEYGVRRWPQYIPDQRLSGRRARASYQCDCCDTRFVGRRHGNFSPDVREIPLSHLYGLWAQGRVDASWYCVKCWHQYLDTGGGRTLQDTCWEIGVQRSRECRRPLYLTDKRFSKKQEMRWMACDTCRRYCAAATRDYMPGSFVYGASNQLAGPGSDRSRCFPLAALRQKWWAQGWWNAEYACRSCLPHIWRTSRAEVDKWLKLWHNTGPESAARAGKVARFEGQPRKVQATFHAARSAGAARPEQATGQTWRNDDSVGRASGSRDTWTWQGAAASQWSAPSASSREWRRHHQQSGEVSPRDRYKAAWR